MPIDKDISVNKIIMMSMEKSHRFHIISAILAKGDVHSQTVLRKRLKKQAISVSQATISRDLKELGYARAPIADGSYRLVKVADSEEHIGLLFKLGQVELVSAGNILIIKTRPGNAQAVAGAIDRARIEGILGTVAGDDAIFAVTKNESIAQKVIKNLKRYLE